MPMLHSTTKNVKPKNEIKKSKKRPNEFDL